MQSYSEKPENCDRQNEDCSTEVPDVPKRLLLGLNDGYCNLKCPGCYVHGSDDTQAVRQLRGHMPFDEASKVFEEVKDRKIFLSPVLWSEPLLIKDLQKYIRVMKERGFYIFINTNGLLLTEELAKFFVSTQIHTIFVSIDAMTGKTLKKVRGIDDLKRIQESVFRMLRAREHRPSPRIGVSFVESKANSHERDDFVSYWLEYVDVVRVNDVFEQDNKVEKSGLRQKRIPCGSLYDTMAINHKGDVPICCLDSFNTTNMGNVFCKGVKNVWHGEKFQEIRQYHETGQYEQIPLCRRCDVWSNYLVEETDSDGIMIRKSPIMTYYNRIDRLFTWHS